MTDAAGDRVEDGRSEANMFAAGFQGLRMRKVQEEWRAAATARR